MARSAAVEIAAMLQSVFDSEKTTRVTPRIRLSRRRRRRRNRRKRKKEEEEEEEGEEEGEEHDRG